jgi:hypothetical protein
VAGVDWLEAMSDKVQWSVLAGGSRKVLISVAAVVFNAGGRFSRSILVTVCVAIGGGSDIT